MTIKPATFDMERHDLKTISVANPAAGNAAVYTIPVGEVHQIVGVRFRLATGAAAANRRARVYPLDALGTTPFQGSIANLIQVTALTYTYWFSCGISFVDATADMQAAFCPLACGIQLQAGEQLQMTANNLQALDQIDTIRLRSYVWKLA